jgi:sulfite reductase (NADPH) flavoprotein alpha-component
MWSNVSDRPAFSLVVAYGSDMGTAEYIAMQFCDDARAVGIETTEIELNQLPVTDLQTATHFVVVTSTFGDGEFPDNANLFWESLHASTDRLEHLHFAVLSLGDSSYELFCNAGILLDTRLEELGAVRLADRVDVDCYFEGHADEWKSDVVKLLQEAHDAPQADAANIPDHPAADAPRRNVSPVNARVLVNRLLTAPQSDKEVRHYEIDLADTGIAYEAGDSIAVHAANDPALVEAVLTRLGVGADHTVADHDRPLGELLAEHLEIRTPSRALQELVATRTGDAAVAAALGGDDPELRRTWLYGRDVLDLIEHTELTVDELVEVLRPLQFRDYSIASSPLAHPDRLHLTVATVRYRLADRGRSGVASSFLAHRCESVRMHLRPNHAFRLPAHDVPIVMIGPGTGIAPFRAFLQERQACGATGKSWLFFGDRRRATDFLYGEELHAFTESGTLTRLDLAFSRDGDGPKRYVWHHMREHAAQLFDWLQDGAHVYVCGDADRMARDVDRTLHEIVEQAGGVTPDAAHAYVSDLVKSHRYVRDVY